MQIILSQPSFIPQRSILRLALNALIYALLAGVGAYRIMMGSTFDYRTFSDLLNYVQQYTKPFNDISSVLAELQKCSLLAQSVSMLS